MYETPQIQGEIVASRRLKDSQLDLTIRPRASCLVTAFHTFCLTGTFANRVREHASNSSRMVRPTGGSLTQ